MSGLSIQLPLVVDEIDGAYKLIKTYKDLVQQNLKMLLFTNPGEKMMEPLFGIGIKQFLFEQQDDVTYSQISSRVYSQVAKYMPFLEITACSIVGSDTNEEMDANSISITIRYRIIPLDLEDVLKEAIQLPGE